MPSAVPPLPATRASLAADLQALGLADGDTLLLHSSLRSLGFVVGGEVAVVQALLDVVGPRGTLVVPAFTAGNSDPSRWGRTRQQAVPEEWWPAIRAHLPAFDPAVTPSEGVGRIAEAVRTWPGAVRSDHPQTSFAAVGPDAARLTGDHHRDCHLGPASPLGRLAEGHAKILLLGVPYAVCTAFHLGEYRRPDPPTRDYECVVAEAGRRDWYRYRDVQLDDGDFQQLGEAFEEASPRDGAVRRGLVGTADSRLLPLADAVAFAREWFVTHRG